LIVQEKKVIFSIIKHPDCVDLLHRHCKVTDTLLEP